MPGFSPKLSGMRRRLCLLLLAAFAAAQVVRADDMPRLLGEVSGGFLATALRDAPPLRWKVTLEPAAPQVTRLRVAAEGDGLRLSARFELQGGTDDGRWRLDEAVLDLGRWFPAVQPRLGSAPASLQAGGELVLTGEGTLRDGVPAGTLHVVWRKGSVGDDTAAWRVDGIDLDAELAFDGASETWTSTRTATLTVGTISTSRFGARNLAVRGRWRDRNAFALEAARVEIAGGEVTAAPATISLAPLAIELELELRRVGLQDVAALVPQAVAEARGRIDGKVVVRWNEGQGFDLGNGKLVLRHDEPAEVRLHPTPGLITSALPWYILKFYPGLRDVERGELPIAAEVLEVTLTPEGDAEGRTAVVHLAGGPTDPRHRAPVDLNVNVRAPLKTFIDFGTSMKW